MRFESKRARLAIAALTLVILAAAGWLIYSFATRIPENQRQAIEASREAAQGFDEDSIGRSVTRLNAAIDYAYEGKCEEARAVYGDAAENPNGLTDTDVKAFKQRIEEICSGEASIPDENKY